MPGKPESSSRPTALKDTNLPSTLVDKPHLRVSLHLKDLFNDSLQALQGVSDILQHQRIEINKARSDSSIAHAQIQQLESQLKTTQESLNSLRSDFATLKTAKEKLMRDIMPTKVELNSVKARLDGEKKIKAGLEGMVADLRVRFSNEERGRKEIGKKLSIFKKEARSERHLRVALEKNVKRLAEVVQEQDIQNAQMTAQISAGRPTLVDVGVQCNDLEIDLLREEMENLRQKLAQKDMDLELVEATLAAEKNAHCGTTEAYSVLCSKFEDRKSSQSELAAKFDIIISDRQKESKMLAVSAELCKRAEAREELLRRENEGLRKQLRAQRRATKNEREKRARLQAVPAHGGIGSSAIGNENDTSTRARSRIYYHARSPHID